MNNYKLQLIYSNYNKMLLREGITLAECTSLLKHHADIAKIKGLQVYYELSNPITTISGITENALYDNTVFHTR